MKCELAHIDLNGNKISCNNVASHIKINAWKFSFIGDRLIDNVFTISVCDSCYKIVIDSNKNNEWVKEV